MSSEEQQIKQILAQAQKIKQNHINVGAGINSYLTYQLQKIKQKQKFFACFSQSSPTLKVSDDFKRAFKTLTKLQKARFYLMNVKNVGKICKSLSKTKRQFFGWDFDQTESPDRNLKNILCFSIKDDTDYKTFQLVKAQIYQKLSKIVVDNKKQIDLKSYIMRKSRDKDVKNCVVLQAMDEQAVDETIRLCFSSQQFQKKYEGLLKTWNRAQFIKVCSMVSYGSLKDIFEAIIKVDNTSQNVSLQRGLQLIRKSLMHDSTQFQSNLNPNQ